MGTAPKGVKFYKSLASKFRNRGEKATKKSTLQWQSEVRAAKVNLAKLHLQKPVQKQLETENTPSATPETNLLLDGLESLGVGLTGLWGQNTEEQTQSETDGQVEVLLEDWETAVGTSAAQRGLVTSPTATKPGNNTSSSSTQTSAAATQQNTTQTVPVTDLAANPSPLLTEAQMEIILRTYVQAMAIKLREDIVLAKVDLTIAIGEYNEATAILAHNARIDRRSELNQLENTAIRGNVSRKVAQITASRQNNRQYTNQQVQIPPASAPQVMPTSWTAAILAGAYFCSTLGGGKPPSGPPRTTRFPSIEPGGNLPPFLPGLKFPAALSNLDWYKLQQMLNHPNVGMVIGFLIWIFNSKLPPGKLKDFLNWLAILLLLVSAGKTYLLQSTPRVFPWLTPMEAYVIVITAALFTFFINNAKK